MYDGGFQSVLLPFERKSQIKSFCLVRWDYTDYIWKLFRNPFSMKILTENRLEHPKNISFKATYEKCLKEKFQLEVTTEYNGPRWE